jgi:hypothetical protein
MKTALLIFGIFATGIGTLLFFALAIASSWAEENETPHTDEN